ncbi:hypothetical protein [Streptomyces sp. 6-11-2]|uniref:hypothetical protein n=1 Tax=Streptomyces sp. 6-11-2 TaxID=2585753 RepID=UPI00116DFA4B|nr:hypothetical protein [Streptomyces sp. 6-11-2]GED86445.1 hypothetical protein TNCT6_35300 [Streptomyces sp. 6-11-2]
MTAPDSLPLHALAEDNLASASPDLLRAMKYPSYCGFRAARINDSSRSTNFSYRRRDSSFFAGISHSSHLCPQPHVCHMCAASTKALPSVGRKGL